MTIGDRTSDAGQESKTQKSNTYWTNDRTISLYIYVAMVDNSKGDGSVCGNKTNRFVAVRQDGMWVRDRLLFESQTGRCVGVGYLDVRKRNG